MFYKVPMPTKTNGVKLHTLPNNQIVVEYERGEPHVGPLAYDSSCGILNKNVTFRKSRPDLDKIIADAQRKVDGQDGLPPSTGVRGATQERGSRMGPIDANEKPRLRDVEDGGNEEASPYKRFTEDDEDNDAIVTKLMSYLNDKLTPEQLSSVAAILGSRDDDAPDSDAGEPRQATDRRRASRLAADAARYRPMTAAENAEFDRLFPTAKLILRR